MASDKPIFIREQCKLDKTLSLCKKCCNVPIEISSNYKTTNKLDIFLVGEAPGKTEAESGRPFIGITGELLRSVLKQLTTELDFTYAISNIVKARPTDGNNNNRTPTEEERDFCGQRVLREIKKLKPSVVIAIGGTAYEFLMKVSKGNITENRGCIRTSPYGFNCLGTFHPSFISRHVDKCQIGFLYNDLKRTLWYVKKGIDFRIPNESKSELITTVKDVKNLLTEIKNTKKPCAVDTETRNLGRVYDNRILSIQLSNDGKIGYVIPIDHYQSPFDPKQLTKVKNAFIDFFTTSETAVRRYLFWNAKFDLHQMFREFHTLIFNKNIYDCMIAASLLEENLLRTLKGKQSFHFLSLGFQCWQHGFSLYKDNEKMEKENRANLKNIPIDDWKDYAAADVTTLYNIYYSQLKEAKFQNFDKQLKILMRHLTHKISCLTTYAEHCGLPTDYDTVKFLQSKRTSPLLKAITDCRQDLYSMESVKKANSILLRQKGGINKGLFAEANVFNIGKRSLQELLFLDILKLEPVKQGKTGKGKLDKEFQKVYQDVPEVAKLMEYNRVLKLFTSYVKNISKRMSRKVGEPDVYTDQRVRPNFTTNTVTGRLSANNPNTQQRVSKGDRAEVVLSMFKAKPNRAIVKLDFRVHEVRGLAIVSKDPEMTANFNKVYSIRKDYRNNPDKYTKEELKILTDVHVQNAAKFFRIDPIKVDKESRSRTKNLIFGTTYGMSDQSLAAMLNVPVKKAVEIKNEIFSKLNVAIKWLDNEEKKGQKNFYVESPLGRRRRLWGFLFPSKNKAIISQMRRYCRNSSIQGMCSDFSLIGAYLLLQHILKIGKAKYQVPDDKMWAIINLIHDSGEFEIPCEDVYDFLMISEKFFTTTLKKYLIKHFGMEIGVNLEVDYEVGLSFDNLRSWDGTEREAKELQEWVTTENKTRLKEERKQQKKKLLRPQVA